MKSAPKTNLAKSAASALLRVLGGLLGRFRARSGGLLASLARLRLPANDFILITHSKNPTPN